MKQMTLHLEHGLSQRNRCLRDHMATRIYGSRDGLVGTAGKLDMSPSKLTEKLAGCDSGGKSRGMTIDELENYIQRTGDISPVHYLVDKYLRDPEIVQAEALAKIASLVEQLPALFATAGLNVPKGRSRS